MDYKRLFSSNSNSSKGIDYGAVVHTRGGGWTLGEVRPQDVMRASGDDTASTTKALFDRMLGGVARADSYSLSTEQALLNEADRETAAVLRDHPDILHRVAKLREEGSTGKNVRELMAELDIEE